MPKDKELADHERAHTGKPGAKARHGADVVKGNLQSQYERRFNYHVNKTDGDIQEARRRAKDDLNIPYGND